MEARMTHSNQERSRTFRQLHAGPDMLILANAWDAASARLIESVGAKAIATTSAGVAWSHGYADGHALPVPLLVGTVADIARVIGVPLTVDIEGGYSADPKEAAEAVARVADAGAVGINLEDGTDTPDLLCAKIEHAKRAAARAGVDLFVNARTDVYLRGLAHGDAAVAETIGRGRRYREAGADGWFVPGVVEPAAIRALVDAVPLPLNVLAWPGVPAAAELQALGVRRLSAGAGVALAALSQARSVASAFLSDGRVVAPPEPVLTSRQANALFGRLPLP
jgi:2-methylisocitrate lyase-like PEP mutase family enzyme